MTVSAASLNFGSVTVNTATTQSLTLTSTGTSPVTVNSAAITGAGFTIVGGNFADHAEPDAVDDVAGAVQTDSNWSRERTNHDQQQLVEREHGGGGSERHERGSPESAVDGERCEPELRQRDSEHGDDAVVDADVYRDIACYGEFGIDYGGGFTLVGGTLPATLNPMQSMTLQVQFCRQQLGPQPGRLQSAATRRLVPRRWWL